MKCRLMTLNDLDAIMEIEHEAFTIPWSRQSFTDELTRNGCARYLVIEQDGAPVGYGGMWFVVDEAHVTNIAIKREYRGRGLGKQLMEDMLQFAADSGMAFMTLEVRRSNDVAQSLYRSHGFIDVGYRKRYYEDNHEDALIMTTLSLPEAHPENDPFLVVEDGGEE
jgi:ribosomal-protein-alanine N-acetyltransferase